MWRMCAIENTGFRSLRCFRWCWPTVERRPKPKMILYHLQWKTMHGGNSKSSGPRGYLVYGKCNLKESRTL